MKQTKALGTRKLKGGIGSLFDTCVNAMGRRPYWPSRMEESYCTFGLGAICAHYHHRECVHDLSPCAKGNSRIKKLLGGLSYEKIRKYNNSPPYVTARFPPETSLIGHQQQLPLVKGLSVYIVLSKLYFFPNPHIFRHIWRELHWNNLPI